MTRTFIQTTEFEKNWEHLDLIDDDLRRLELEILRNPKVGSVIPGTGRLRKMRFAYEDKGKSGSTRVCYVDFPEKQVIYLIIVYSKSEKDNLTKGECNNIKRMIQILEESI